MPSPLLTLPLRTESQALTETEDSSISRLISIARGLEESAREVAPRLGFEARRDVLEFANGLHDLIGDTLRAWEVRRANERDDAAGTPGPGNPFTHAAE